MTTNYTQYGYSSNNCHKGSTKVFAGSLVEVYAGGRSHDPEYSGMDIIIDLTGGLKFIKWPIPEAWRSAKFMKTPNVLALEITDSKAPWFVDLDFWKALWEDFMEQAKVTGKGTDNKYKVLVVCQGGHGRTGTVITALAIAAGVTDTKPGRDDLLACIRERYCKEAVETKDQIEYLKEVCGLVTDEVGSNTKIVTSSYTGGSTHNPAVANSIPASDKGTHGGWCFGKGNQCLLKKDHKGDCLSPTDGILWDAYVKNGYKVKADNDDKKGGDGQGSITASVTQQKTYGKKGTDGVFHTWEAISKMSTADFSKAFPTGLANDNVYGSYTD